MEKPRQPVGSGLALAIIQHLDPTHKGIMPELLQRATGMEVSQGRDRMRVKPNCVYEIPPNKDMSILHGVLHLFEPTAPRGLDPGDRVARGKCKTQTAA